MKLTMTQSRATLFPLLLIMFVDGLGQGVLLPILAETLVNTASDALVHFNSALLRNIIWGGILASFFLSRFFGSIWFLDWAESKNYKTILSFSLIIAIIGYLLSGLAFNLHHVFWLFVGRFIAGFAAGNQSLAQTIVLNNCNIERKISSWRLTVFYLTLGIIAGPLIGGFFGSHWIISWFNPALPMYLIAGLIIFNLALLHCFPPQKTTENSADSNRLSYAFHTLTAALKNKTIRSLTIVFLLLQLGWYVYYFHVAGFLMTTFHMNATTIGSYISLIGVGLSLGFLRFADYFAKRWSLRFVVVLGCLIHAAGVLICIILPWQWLWWAAVMPATAGFAIAYATILILFSLQTHHGSQHWMTTVTSAVISIAAVIAPLLTGFLATVNDQWPFWASVLFLAAAALLLKAFRKIG